MDPSVFGTGGIVLNKANSALNAMSVGSKTVPGYGSSGFVTQNGLGQVEPTSRFLQLSWALPTGSPADFPIVLSFNSESGGSTEFGNNWGAPYNRFAESNGGDINLLTPEGMVSYGSPDVNNNYVGSPNNLNNTLNGSSTSGWTETQPDGTTFNYDTSGFLRTIRNNAGVRWTLTWNSGFTLVEHIDGPLGRRTSFAYDGSNNIRRIQDPSGRITSLTVNAGNLVRIVTPELCTTSLVYNSTNSLAAWIDPLGLRTF
jgi:YD repeat-containing protein